VEPVKAAKLPGWPDAPASLPCDHAGLLLLFPAMAGLQLPALVRAAGYPSTRQLTAWQSTGSLLLAKCDRTARIHHVGSLADDAKLDRYENATPDRIWRHFLDATGTLHITPAGITCALNLRSHHRVLIDAASPTSKPPSPGGPAAPCASGSRHADEPARET
jgi:hypothetical protein